MLPAGGKKHEKKQEDLLYVVCWVSELSHSKILCVRVCEREITGVCLEVENKITNHSSEKQNDQAMPDFRAD